MKVPAVALLSLPMASGFISSSNSLPASIGQLSRTNNLSLPTFQQKFQAKRSHGRCSAIRMAIPLLNDWAITSKGEATGVVKNHPDPQILDGEFLTTSVLSTKKDKCLKGAIVVTASGSKYKLGTQRGGGDSRNGFGSFGILKKDPPKATPAKSPSFARSALFGGSKVATLDNWSVNIRGEVSGSALNHPDKSIKNGELLSTSKINEDRNSLKEGQTITTATGSKYILGRKKETSNSWFGGGSKASNPSQNVAPVPTPAPKSSAAPASKPFNPFGTFEMLSKSISEAGNEIKRGSQQIANASQAASSKMSSSFSSPPTSASKSNVKQEAKRIANLRDLKIKYGINGKTVGNGDYLLCDKPKRSTSGKSNIWSAYRAGADGMPTGDKLTVKISTNFEAIYRESDNYNRVCSGLFPGKFVEKSEFLPATEGTPNGEFKNTCALVIESGRKDLKAILSERNMRGFEGKAMRDAASAALQCIQAMHSSGIVWTDLKTENFVIVSDEIGDNGILPGVKGIDLESAMPRKSNPVDFSPEACPPEFASAFIAGEGLDFKLDYSYDIWSYGMMLYELHTGKNYFGSKTPAQITKSLQYGTFEADTSMVTDPKLKDLIDRCLQADPKKRPGVTQLLLHPYFLSSGIGPFGF